MTVIIITNVVFVTLEGMFFLPLALHGTTSWLSSTFGKITLLLWAWRRKHRWWLTNTLPSWKTKTSRKGLGSLPGLHCHLSQHLTAANLSAPYLWEISTHTHVPLSHVPPTPRSSASYLSLLLCHIQIFGCSNACDLPFPGSRNKHCLCCLCRILPRAYSAAPCHDAASLLCKEGF